MYWNAIKAGFRLKLGLANPCNTSIIQTKSSLSIACSPS